jgi:hypothetical protein
MRQRYFSTGSEVGVLEESHFSCEKKRKEIRTKGEASSRQKLEQLMKGRKRQ